MSSSIRIGRVLGIPVYLHLTFLLILPLFVYLFSAPNSQITFLGLPMTFKDLDSSLLVKYLFGTAAAIIFFVTVFIHELAHSYLALRYGVKIRSITLMIFGGVSSMEDMPKKPGQEWRMAFAGPFSSLLVGAASYGLMLLFDLGPANSVLLDGLSILAGVMAVYNIILAGFNMIPAFPMDGGRVLRAYFATRMPYVEATRKAARWGRYFAIGMAVVGIFANFLLILVALFVYIGATEEEQAVTITESLSGVPVGQLMTREVQVVHPDTTIQQLHGLMLATGHMGFPVVDSGLVGMVTHSDSRKVDPSMSSVAKVGDVMTRPVVTVTPETDSAKALRLLHDRQISRLVVLDQGAIVGIVTLRDFMRAVDAALAKGRMMRWGEQFSPPSPPVSPV